MIYLPYDFAFEINLEEYDNMATIVFKWLGPIFFLMDMLK